MKQVLLVVVVFAGCGGGHGQPADDGPMVDALDPGPWTIAVTQGDPLHAPTLVAVREGDATAWRALPAGATSFVVADPRYQLATVCEYTSGGAVVEPLVFLDAQSVSDPRTFTTPCGSQDAGEAGPPPITVTGTVAQPATLYFGYQTKMSATPAWDFSFSVAPGTYDALVADDTRFVLQRDLALAADTALPAFDLDAAGKGFTHTALTVDGAQPGDRPIGNTNYVFFDDRQNWQHDSGDTTVTALPPDVLEAGDLQYVRLGTGPTTQPANTRSTHGVELDFDAATTPTSYTLMPPLADVTFDGTHTSWKRVDDIDGASFFQDGNSYLLRAFYTSAWLASGAVAVTSIDTDVTGLPSYDPKWSPPAKTNRTIYVYRDLGVNHFDDVFAQFEQDDP